MSEKEKCEHCNRNDAEPMHICPFLDDIHNDSETLCNCCDHCTHECAMDV